MNSLALLTLVASALAADSSITAGPSALPSDAPIPISKGYTGTVASSYYAALNSFYGQPEVASAVSVARTLNSDAQISWVSSFYGKYNTDLASIAQQYSEVFTQDGVSSGSVSVPSGDSSLNAAIASITSGHASASESGKSGKSDSKSGSKSGSDSDSKSGSKSDSKSGSKSDSKSDSKSSSKSDSKSSGSGSSDSSSAGGSTPFVAAGGVIAGAALLLL